MDAALLGMLGVVAAATLTGTAGIVVRRAGRGVDEATARKTRAETTGVEINNMKMVLDTVRTNLQDQLATQKTAHDEQITELRATHDERIKELRSRLSSVEEQQHRYLAAILAHLPWDTDALSELRRTDPRWPSPPPLDRP